MTLPATLAAQQFEQPAGSGKSSFAVITDSKTKTNCAAEIAEYKGVIESEGLPVFVVWADWESPEQVKGVLQKLHRCNGRSADQRTVPSHRFCRG